MNQPVPIQIPLITLRLHQKLSLALVAIGFLMLGVALSPISEQYPIGMFLLSSGLITIGALAYIMPMWYDRKPGIKHDRIFFNSFVNRGVWGWIAAVFFTGFYVVLYWFPERLEYLIRTTDWLSGILRNKPADQWFLYGFYYTLAVMIMGLRMMAKNRHSRYQLIRTVSVIFFQLGFAFLLPGLLQKFNQPEFYFSYFWPLKYNYLFPNDINWLVSQPGGLGTFMVFWGAVMSFIATPILTYFFGKRWYCSWACGCGGLAETLGDPYRHLSDKSLRSWKIERYSVYGVLAFVVITTAVVWINSLSNGLMLGSVSASFSNVYGFVIGALFSGVIGVGFYPLMGSRVWCRFGCPMAAYLGILQKYFSRFRITTNGGQCISCGNCSTYCEMGIDVRAYAQRGQNIVRASCVGCGICSAVCPRGVLNLENGPIHSRQ